MNKGKRVLTIVSIFILIGALAFVTYKLFQVRTIAVLGCSACDEQKIIELTGIEYDQSVFEIDTDAVLQSLGTQPFIKPVSVEIKYPDVVEIKLKERVRAAYVQKEGVLVVIDDECFVLEVLSIQGQADLPKVTGLQMDDFTVGQRVGAADMFALDVLSAVLQHIKASTLGVNAIDVSTAANIKLSLDNGFTIEIGDDTQLARKFNLLQTSIKELTQMGKSGGTLDVSAVSNAYYSEN